MHEVHLHDNRGGHADLHLPLGTGNIDVRWAVRQLIEHKYDGTITLEVFSPDRQHLAYSRDVLREIVQLNPQNAKSYQERLRQMGVERVSDSRSLDFFNHVMEVTGGRGVDIVLNSLSGRFIEQSLKCLAPFGRFIELGKSDIYRNQKLSLERLGENISYFAVDVDRLAAQKPELHQQVMAEVVALFERGEVEPHEITEFPIYNLPEAMKFMTRAAYRGEASVGAEPSRVKWMWRVAAQLGIIPTGRPAAWVG